MQTSPRPSVSAVLEAHARSQRVAFGDPPALRPTELRTFTAPEGRGTPSRPG